MMENLIIDIKIDTRKTKSLEKIHLQKKIIMYLRLN